jgi:hypothetical protein
MKKSRSEVMEKADFKKETIELAQSSQYFIESLWVIGAEVSKLHASLSSVFSSFFGFLLGIIDYQLFLRRFDNKLILNRLIQGLTLNRIELLVPHYLGAEKAILQKAEVFSTQTGKLAIPFLLNLSVVKAASNLTTPLSTRYSEPVSFLKTEKSEVTTESLEEQLSATAQKTLFQRMAGVQTQLWSRIAPDIKKMSSTLLEYEKQAIPLTFLAAASAYSLLDSAVISGRTPYSIVAPMERDTVKPGLPERAIPMERDTVKPGLPERAIPMERDTVKPGLPEPVSQEISREDAVEKAFGIEPAPSDLTGGTTFDPETLMKIGYAINLTTAIAEKQAPFLEMIAAVSGVLASPVAATVRIPAEYEYAGTEPEMQPLILPRQRASLKKRDTPFTSLIQKGSETLQRAQVSLSEIPIKASNVEKLVTETLMQPIPSLQASSIYRYRETAPQTLKPAGLKPEMKLAPVEAFRIPSILTSLIAYNIQTYPRLPSEPAVSHIYERPIEVDQIFSKKRKKPSDILEPQKVSKMPIASAFAAIENLLTQKWQQESATFMKKIQISRSTYAKLIAELGAAGPVRTALLGELAIGSTTPHSIDTIPPSTETNFPYTSEPYPFTVQPATTQSLRQPTPSQNVININVFADTAEEDLRDLERKISKILSEQMTEVGAVEPIRTALLGELATGSTTPYRVEIQPSIAPSVSQKPFGQDSVRLASQDTVDVNVFADTAEEDLRDLERKISKILSEQISRYYGSSKV